MSEDKDEQIAKNYADSITRESEVFTRSDIEYANYHGIQRGRADREKELLGGEPDGYQIDRFWQNKDWPHRYKLKVFSNKSTAWAALNPSYKTDMQMLLENGWQIVPVKIIKMEKV